MSLIHSTSSKNFNTKTYLFFLPGLKSAYTWPAVLQPGVQYRQYTSCTLPKNLDSLIYI